MTNDELKEVIAEATRLPIPPTVSREVELLRGVGKADVLIGMRRTGKSSILFQEASKAIEAGASRGQIAYFNFDNLAFTDFRGADLLRLVETWMATQPKAERSTPLLLLDEIQQIDGWERATREMIESKRARIMITGSSAKLLSQEIATSLRGRSLSTEVWPFSLSEAMKLWNIAIPKRWPLSRSENARIGNTFDRYFESGGFPEVLSLTANHRDRVLSEYVDIALLRDVIERFRVSNVVALKRLVAQLMRSSGRRVSINKFSQDFSSQKIEVSKNTLYEYQAHLEDAFVFFSVPIFSESPRKQQTNPAKNYAIDPALVRANTLGASDKGLALETLVYIELRRRGLAPTYYISPQKREVDFVTRDKTGSLTFYQVAWSIFDDRETQMREIKALSDARKEFPDATFVAVTSHDSGRIQYEDGLIVHVIPYYRWVLQKESLQEA